MNNTLNNIVALKTEIQSILNSERNNFLGTDELINLIKSELNRDLTYSNFIRNIDNKNENVGFFNMGYDYWLDFILKFLSKVKNVLQFYVSTSDKKAFQIHYEIDAMKILLERMILIVDNFVERNEFSITIQSKSENDEERYYNLRGFWFDNNGKKVKNINEHVNFVATVEPDSKDKFKYLQNNDKDINDKISDRFRNILNKLFNRFDSKIYLRPDNSGDTIYYTIYNAKEIEITKNVDLNYLFSFIIFSKQLERIKDDMS